MAEATLNDVTAMLQMQNEEQGKTTSAVTALVQRIQGLIDIQKRSILDEAETRREAGRNGGAEPPSATDAAVTAPLLTVTLAVAPSHVDPLALSSLTL